MERRAMKAARAQRLRAASLLIAASLLLASCEVKQSGDTPPDKTQSVEGVSEREERPLVTAGAPVLDAADGLRLYDRNCAVCHGIDGGGSLGPPLAGNRNLASSVYVVARIQLGGGGMPPFITLLSDEEIAAAASFIRTAWENDYGRISARQAELQWHGYRRGMRYGTGQSPDGS
jgi:mono/diheme cytochrome c family protein